MTKASDDTTKDMAHFYGETAALKLINNLIDSGNTHAHSNPFTTKKSSICIKAMMGFSWSEPEQAVYLNLRSNQQFYEQPTLMENNVMAGISWQGEQFSPAFDMLLMPEGSGLTLTPSFTTTLIRRLTD